LGIYETIFSIPVANQLIWELRSSGLLRSE